MKINEEDINSINDFMDFQRKHSKKWIAREKKRKYIIEKLKKGYNFKTKKYGK